MIEIANVTWFWHKCFVRNSDGEKYYLCTMGDYQMLVREHWNDRNQDIHWKPMIAKWNDDRQIYDELHQHELPVRMDLHKRLVDCQQYLQKWYITFILSDKLVLGEIDANIVDFKLGDDPEQL